MHNSNKLHCINKSGFGYFLSQRNIALITKNAISWAGKKAVLRTATQNVILKNGKKDVVRAQKLCKKNHLMNFC